MLTLNTLRTWKLTANESPAYGWSLLTAEMLADIDTWRYNYGPMTANSVFRNPSHNALIGGATNSRHMHGDAIDIANPTVDQNGRNALIASLPTGSSYPDYIEPTTLACHLNCVHADWRNHSQTYAHTYLHRSGDAKEREDLSLGTDKARYKVVAQPSRLEFAGGSTND